MRLKLYRMNIDFIKREPTIKKESSIKGESSIKRESSIKKSSIKDKIRL
ncbi:hypothetical protein [uncultured Clostridium sp.]|nr:hypothetical protein [uncultured Clostridium sp.]